MLKTILIIFLFNTATPEQAPRMVHKAFESPAACIRGWENTIKELPRPEGIVVAGYCATVTDLAEEGTA